MVHLFRSCLAVLPVALYASFVIAARSDHRITSKFSTHRARKLPSGITVETYHPTSTYKTFGEGIEHPLSKREASTEDAAIAFLHSHQDVQHDALHVVSTSDGDVAKHVYFKQRVNGLPIVNAVANVAFNKGNKVVAYGTSFVKPSMIASSTPSVSLTRAIATAEIQLNGTHDAGAFPAPQLQYLAKDDGSVVLVHSFLVANKTTGTWFDAHVDAHTGELASVTDLVAHATYRALPVWKEAPSEGFEILVNPEDMNSSPLGWVTDNTTAGNNAIALDNSGSPTTQCAPGPVFDYPTNLSTAPSTPENVHAARVNTFYVVNAVHDILYKYGFTEAAFNFQNNNFGLGGKQGDRVQIMVQSTFLVDNSAFVTMQDGLPGLMYMFLWDYTDPERDGSLENDIIAHEYAHGLTGRLTGGGTASCLQTDESRGLGEGWSDGFADWLHLNDSSVPDFYMAQYVTNNTAGYRSHPYSTSNTTNPLRYSSLATIGSEAHAVGEVWANILHNVFAALVDANGFSSTARTDASGTAGNVVFLRLFVDSLALQPCNPTFVNARDAWIQADQNRYAGANGCTLWKAFASRGLGVAAADYSDDSTVPDGC